MRGLTHRLRGQRKMLELNLQAISVQRAIDGALEKLLFVQTRRNFKIFGSSAGSKIFQKCDILPIIEYQNIFNRLFYLLNQRWIRFRTRTDPNRSELVRTGPTWSLEP